MGCDTVNGDKEPFGRRGFTLIELLIALAIMATLLAIVAPRYMDSLDRATEAALRTNLRTIRDAIDQYKADKAAYPATLQELVRERYLRAIPVDPATDQSDSWIIIPPPDGAASGVYDVKTKAAGIAPSGRLYSDM